MQDEIKKYFSAEGKINELVYDYSNDNLFSEDLEPLCYPYIKNNERTRKMAFGKKVDAETIIKEYETIYNAGKEFCKHFENVPDKDKPMGEHTAFQKSLKGKAQDILKKINTLIEDVDY